MIATLATIAVILLLAVTDARAHLDHLGTSDGIDQGRTIQLYKVPGTDFQGRFMKARERWNRLAGVSDFVMVRDIRRSEVIVNKATVLDCWSYPCDGHTLKFPDPSQDLLMIVDTVHGDDLETVALHELGHVYDLAHHPCGDTSSVMSECAGVDYITPHDRAALRQNY